LFNSCFIPDESASACQFSFGPVPVLVAEEEPLGISGIGFFTDQCPFYRPAISVKVLNPMQSITCLDSWQKGDCSIYDWPLWC